MATSSWATWEEGDAFFLRKSNDNMARNGVNYVA